MSVLFPLVLLFTLQTCFMYKCIAYSYTGDTIDQASDTSALGSCLQDRKTHFRINCHHENCGDYKTHCHHENCGAYTHWFIVGLFLDPGGILSPS